MVRKAQMIASTHIDREITIVILILPPLLLPAYIAKSLSPDKAIRLNTDTPNETFLTSSDIVQKTVPQDQD